MKTLLIAMLVVFGSTFLWSQTNIIAAKSADRMFTSLEDSRDNFGLPGDWDAIDTVKFIEEGCIVEIGRYGRIDTLRHADFTQSPHASFFNQYEATTVFVNFDRPKGKIKQDNDHFNGLRRNKFTAFAITLLLLMGYRMVFTSRRQY